MDHDSRYVQRCRQARRLALSLALFGHGLLLAGLAPSLAEWSRLSDLPAGEAAAEAAGVEELALTETPVAGAVGGLDRETWLARLRSSIQDQGLLSDAEKQRRLAEMTGAASAISAKSQEEIAQFLGKKAGSYRVRTYYLDEVNPNLNLGQARIVRAHAFAEKGDLGYTLAFEDLEGDGGVFTLTGEPAALLTQAHPAFGGRPLPPETDFPAGFELQAARVRDIQRWRRSGDPVGRRGSEVCLEDPQGRQITLYLDGRRAEPFNQEQLRFWRNRTGELPNLDTPDTLHPQGFDFASGSLYLVESLPDRDGQKRARVTLIDARGERLISTAYGAEAENYLKNAALLGRDSPLRGLYETVVMPLLPALQEATAKPEGKK